MLDDTQLRAKKIIIFVCILALLTVLGVWLIHFLSMAKLSVQTDNSADYVSITAIKGDIKDNAHSKQSTHEISANVKAGTYEISAFNKSDSVTQTITIKARQSLSFSIDPPKPTEPIPVYGSSVSDLVADSSQLIFLDATHVPMSIDINNSITPLSSPQLLYDAKWATTALGIARDATNNMYVIKAGIVTALGLPFSIDQNSSPHYDISRTGQIYLSKDKNVYYGDAAGNFKKIYSTKNNILGLSAGLDKVAAIVGSDPGQDSGGNIMVIDTSGLVKSSNISSFATIWSPDSKHLLAYGESMAILLDDNLRQVGAFPEKDTRIYAWSDNSSLLYGQSGVLWDYHLDTKRSEQLAIMPGQGQINAIYPSQDGALAYVSAQKANSADRSSDSNQLFGIGLKGQVADHSLVGLSVFIPETVNQCGLNYVNFASMPAILISYPTTASPQNCQSVAQSELQTYGLDINKFQYKLVPQTDE